jgi:hypothetical protein
VTTIFPAARPCSIARCASTISSKPNTLTGLARYRPLSALGDHLLQRDIGQREALGAEHERAAVEAELDAGRNVGDRVELGHRLQATEEAELAYPAAGPGDPQRVAQRPVPH